MKPRAHGSGAKDVRSGPLLRLSERRLPPSRAVAAASPKVRESPPWGVDLSEAIARSARLQIRACDFHRTRLLSHPILVMDAPLPRGAWALAVRGFRHPRAPPVLLGTTPALRV